MEWEYRHEGSVICRLCTIRFIRNFGCCVRWSPTKGSNRYATSAVGVTGFGLRAGNREGFPVVARCPQMHRLFHSILAITRVPNRYVFKCLKESRIVDNRPGTRNTVTGLIGWPQRHQQLKVIRVVTLPVRLIYNYNKSLKFAGPIRRGHVHPIFFDRQHQRQHVVLSQFSFRIRR